MAQAESKVIEEVVTETRKVRHVVLTLTEDEAEALYAILHENVVCSIQPLARIREVLSSEVDGFSPYDYDAPSAWSGAFKGLITL